MTLLYTTTEAIMRRLTGRLAATQQSLGQTPIDPLFLAQVAEQSEARLTAAIKDIYKLPLKSAHPILAEYVELRCVCSIIPVYFQRQNVSDDRGLGELSCREAEKLLEQIRSQMIELEGEEAKQEPDGIYSGATIVTKRGGSTPRPLPPESDRVGAVVTRAEDIRF